MWSRGRREKAYRDEMRVDWTLHPNGLIYNAAEVNDVQSRDAVPDLLKRCRASHPATRTDAGRRHFEEFDVAVSDDAAWYSDGFARVARDNGATVITGSRLWTW